MKTQQSNENTMYWFNQFSSYSLLNHHCKCIAQENKVHYMALVKLEERLELRLKILKLRLGQYNVDNALPLVARSMAFTSTDLAPTDNPPFAMCAYTSKVMLV